MEDYLAKKIIYDKQTTNMEDYLAEKIIYDKQKEDIKQLDLNEVIQTVKMTGNDQ